VSGDALRGVPEIYCPSSDSGRPISCSEGHRWMEGARGSGSGVCEIRAAASAMDAWVEATVAIRHIPAHSQVPSNYGHVRGHYISPHSRILFQFSNSRRLIGAQISSLRLQKVSSRHTTRPSISSNDLSQLDPSLHSDLIGDGVSSIPINFLSEHRVLPAFPQRFD
jgi:hypothetical protein